MYWLSLISAVASFVVTVVAVVHQPVLADGRGRYQDMLDSLVSSERSQAEESLACGPKCLFFALRVCDWQGEYSEVEKLVPLRPDGSSMANLQAASEQLGVQFECKQCSPSAFDNLPLPAIAHLEPSDRSGFGHYVVITARDEAKLRVFDPSIPSVVRADRASLLRAATGFYLVPSDVVTSLWVRRLWFGCGCFCGLAWTLGAAYNSFLARRRHLAQPPLALLVAIPTAVVVVVGCNREGASERVAYMGEVEQTKPLLEVSPRAVRLGVLNVETPAVARFTVRNTSPHEQLLALATPTCNCLDVKLLPGKTLPPNATATVILSLRAADGKRAGFIEGSVQLARVRSTESHELSVDGLIEGVIGNTYTVRPHHITSGSPPALVLLAYSRDATTSISVDGCTSYDGADVQATAGPVALLQKADTGVPRALSVGCFLRTISVPVELPPEARRTSGGWFHFSYRIGGHAFESKSRFFVIAAESDN